MYNLFPPEKFANSKDFPDPMTKVDGHYKSFAEFLGSKRLRSIDHPC